MRVAVIGGWAVPEALLAKWVRQAVPENWEVGFWPLDGSRPGLWPSDTDLLQVDALVGWSLGGQWGVRMAAKRQCPVVTLGSGPRFAPTPERQAWLGAFRQAFDQDPARTLRRFVMMMARGGQHGRRELRAMQEGLTVDLAPRTEALSIGLQALADWDLTDAWRATARLRLSLTFDEDAVFPKMGQDPSTDHLSGGHWPDPEQCRHIRKRLEAWGRV